MKRINSVDGQKNHGRGGSTEVFLFFKKIIPSQTSLVIAETLHAFIVYFLRV